MDSNLEAVARESGLTRVGIRPRLGTYLAEAWSRREFAVTMALYENDAQSAHDILGRWWLILQPAIQATVYGLIFGLLLGGSRPQNFLPFLFTGVFLFTMISSSILQGASTIRANSGLIKSVSFPRILLPAAVTVRQFLDYLPTIPILAIVILIFDHGFKWQTVFFPVLLVAVVMFSFGVAMISARLTVALADVGKLLPFVTRVLFYVSGVFINLDQMFAAHPVLLFISNWNPVYAFMSIARGCLVAGYEIDPYLVMTAGVWTLVSLIAGLLIFWSAEEEFGNV